MNKNRLIVLAISGDESVVQTVELPFSSAGTYDLMIEAASKDRTLAITDMRLKRRGSQPTSSWSRSLRRR